jgi:hypothetical protein
VQHRVVECHRTALIQPSPHHYWDALCHLAGVPKEIVDIEKLEYLMKFLILEFDHLGRSHQPYNRWMALDADRRDVSWRQDWCAPSTLVSRCGQEVRCKGTRRCLTSSRVHSFKVCHVLYVKGCIKPSLSAETDQEQELQEVI